MIGPFARFLRDEGGAATAEFAVCLPVLLIVTFGSLETANSIYTKQTLSLAAYETAVAAATGGQTQADALAHGEELLQSRGITNATISVTPSITATTPGGTEITVTVTAPNGENGLGFMVIGGSTLSSSVAVTRN